MFPFLGSSRHSSCNFSEYEEHCYCSKMDSFPWKEEKINLASYWCNSNIESVVKEEVVFNLTSEIPASYVQSTKRELEIEDFNESEPAQSAIKREHDTEDSKQEFGNAAHVQSTIKQEPEIGVLKEEPNNLSTPVTYVQSIIKEELIIEDFIEEPDTSSLENTSHDNEKENRNYNRGLVRDVFVNRPNTEVDKLNIIEINQVENKSETKEGTTSRKRKRLTNSRSNGSSSTKKPRRTSVVQDPEILSPANEASTRIKLLKTMTVKSLETATETFAKTFCSKCKEFQPVMYRKARCPKCISALRYNCEPCQSTYKTFTVLRYHLKDKHVSMSSSEKIMTCNNCHKTFVALKRLNEHRRACIDQCSFPCQQCSFVTKFKSNLTSHVKSVHNNNFQATCPKCGKNYSHQRSYKRHLKVYCGKSKQISCQHCNKKVYRKHEIVNHLKMWHPHLFDD